MRTIFITNSCLIIQTVRNVVKLEFFNPLGLIKNDNITENGCPVAGDLV